MLRSNPEADMDYRSLLGGQAFVELITHMGDDMSIINSARVSYDGDHAERLPDKDKKLIRYLLKNHHTSPFEHVQFTFHVKAPLFVARQWMRHRTWSYNEISARYAKVEEGYYFPSKWRGQSTDNKQMSSGELPDDLQVGLDSEYYQACETAFSTYNALIAAGVSRELARMVLPTSSFTRFYASVNLHNLLHFLSLRDHPHAQHEIRVYAEAMKDIIQKYVPWTIASWEELRDTNHA